MMLFLLTTKMLACSGILYGYYWFYLRNKRFHRYNRFYLLATTIVSIIIPFVRIPVWFEPDTATGLLVSRSIEIISVGNWEQEFVETPEGLSGSWLTLQNMLFAANGIVILALFGLLCRSLLYIWKISKKYPYKYINDIKFYNTNEQDTPFTFFRSIFWNSRLDLNSREGQQVFSHELFHATQKHSVDIFFLEIARIIFWLNPFFHLIKKEIKAIHEFLADEHAVIGTNEFDYAELLILQSLGAKKTLISNCFFQNHIKRRIAMITQTKNNNYSYWTRLMVLPLSIVLFCAIALYAQNNSPAKTKLSSASQVLPEPITIVVDAGHGGQDDGAKSAAGLLEKDLALSIAKQIKKHAGTYNINVVMTREEDNYPTLRARTDLTKTVKADLMISIHVASATTAAKSGFDMYITKKNQQTLEYSKLLAQNIATHVKNMYEVAPLKQRNNSGIWILDSACCPAVLIECGYITNEKDVAFITASENQEKIAKSILQGVVSYKKEN